MQTKEIGLFTSILHLRTGAKVPPQREDSLRDLALDQAFSQMCQEAPHAALAFRTLLQTVDEVQFRHAVFRGLENGELRAATDSFLKGMAACRHQDARSEKAKHPYQADFLHLSAATNYVEVVGAFQSALTTILPALKLESQGWTQLSTYLAEYCSAPAFTALARETLEVQKDFTDLQINILIRGGKVTVAQTDSEEDLAQSVLETFERFQQRGATEPDPVPSKPKFDQVQAWILARAALLHPEPFARLKSFRRATDLYRDRVLDRFTEEVRFYLAYLDYVAPLRQAGLSLCYPKVSADTKDFRVSGGWDLSLAAQRVAGGKPVVTNDVSLAGDERILVISGPNQGGKTTAARMFGQVHHLAALGCPVPGNESRVFLCDHVFTAFEREENLDSLESRLSGEVKHLHNLFAEATSATVFVINEPFGSTSLHDAQILTRDLFGRISDLDSLAVCVTFIDELSRLSNKTVSMVSAVDPKTPALRTFRIERRVADGQAHAHALAAKHGLTFEQIRSALKNPKVAV